MTKVEANTSHNYIHQRCDSLAITTDKYLNTHTHKETVTRDKDNVE